MRLHRARLWNNSDFVKLWSAQVVSQLGSRITREGLPLAAVLVLQATPVQMGILTAIGALPILLIGLLAGVWVDRLPRKPIMIAADLGRAALLVTVPVAAVLGWLGIEQLYLIAALTAALTVFFNVADQSFLPSVVRRQDLVDANSKLASSSSVAEMGGPAVAGLLVQWLTAPIAILFDALSFVISAVCIGWMRTPDPKPAPTGAAPNIKREVLEGLRIVWGQPMLRSLALAASISTFFGNFFGALYGLYVVRDLGLSPATLGVLISLGGVGAFGGSLVAGWAARRFGVGPALVGSRLISVALTLLTPLAASVPAWAVALLAVSQLMGDFASIIYFINEVSLRQTLVPDHLLGRANASMQVMVGGLGPVGALVGGMLATALGAQATLFIAALGILASTIWLVASPVRVVREAPVSIALAE
ncbi:MAG: MFS transporter [Anaerolineae bacterium]|nr:MFS transporter [Anaerolineae bacterium]